MFLENVVFHSSRHRRDCHLFVLVVAVKDEVVRLVRDARRPTERRAVLREADRVRAEIGDDRPRFARLDLSTFLRGIAAAESVEAIVRLERVADPVRVKSALRRLVRRNDTDVEAAAFLAVVDTERALVAT